MYGRKNYMNDEWHNIEFWERRNIVHTNYKVLADLQFLDDGMKKLFKKVSKQLDYYQELEQVYNKFPKTYMQLNDEGWEGSWYMARVYCPNCDIGRHIKKRKLKKLLDTVWSCTKCFTPFFVERTKLDYRSEDIRDWYMKQWKEFNSPKLIVNKPKPPETIDEMTEFIDKRIKQAMDYNPIRLATMAEQKEAFHIATENFRKEKMPHIHPTDRESKILIEQKWNTMSYFEKEHLVRDWVDDNNIDTYNKTKGDLRIDFLRYLRSDEE